MIPHERSLVKRMEGKPFVLLGVDSDATREELKKAIKEKHITWRNWFDGSQGPIAKAWDVEGFPTIYILDAKGVIRYKGLHGRAGSEIDKDVDTLLKEMAGGKGAAASRTGK
jgi:hypothetical protein